MLLLSTSNLWLEMYCKGRFHNTVLAIVFGLPFTRLHWHTYPTMPTCMSGRMHGRAHEIHILRNGRVHKIKRGHPSTRVDEYPLPVTLRNNVTGIFNLQVFSNFFIYFYMSRFTCKKNAYCTAKQYSTTIPVVFSFLMAFLVISKIVS